MSLLPAVTILLQIAAGPSAPRVYTEQIQKGLVALLASQNQEVPGWPWERSGNRVHSNLGGVIALSLVDLYEQRRDPATWVTLVQYADHLRTVYAAGDTLPFKADLEFLVRASDLGLDEEGRVFARDLFARVQRVSPLGRDEYARIAKGRAGIDDVVGYDVALTIRAALAVGAREYAADVADAALAAGRLSLAKPEHPLQVTSAGAMLHAVALLGRAEDRRSVEQAARDLIRAQAEPGSWGSNDTQATAYAVLGLRAVPGIRGSGEAALLGQAWLLERQLRSGAWGEYHDGLKEPFVGPVRPLINAEALAALATGP